MATLCKGPVWDPHSENGVEFDLSHVHPFFLEHRIDAVPGKPGRPGRVARDVRLYVTFSHHCFTQSLEKVAAYKEEQVYSNGEARCFCPRRWELSQALPQLIRDLPTRRSYHTRHHNYLTVEAVSGGSTGHYTVYFRASKSKVVDVDMYIESAYVRFDSPHLQGGAWKMGFNAILAHILDGRVPHPPPKR